MLVLLLVEAAVADVVIRRRLDDRPILCLVSSPISTRTLLVLSFADDRDVE